MNLPTPTKDPTGFVGAVTALVAALFTAIDPSGALGDRWQPVVFAVVVLASLVWARRHAWTEASVQALLEEASMAQKKSAPRTGKARS